MRLGEILHADGLASDAAIASALRSQAALGGRIGTNLIELGAVTGDQVANALAQQKGVPAARRKHLDAVDRSLLRLVPRHIAERHSAIPIGIATRYGRELVVAFLDPDDIAAVDEVGFAAGMPVRPSVAPEYYIIQYLDRLYGIPPRRFLRSPQVAALDAALDPADAGGRTAARPAAPPATPAAAPRLPPLEPVLAAPPPTPPGDASPGPAPASGRLSTVDAGWDDLPVDLPPPAPPAAAIAPPRAAPSLLSADDALAVLATADDRDAVGAAIVGYLRMTFGCGAVLICKQDAALGWLGSFPEVDADLIESIAIPLSAPSAFQRAYAARAPFAGRPPADGDDVQRRLWKLLRCPPPAEVIVVPVVIGTRVVNLVYAHAADGGPLPAGHRLADVCAAAGDAFARIIRARKSS
ncbi:MAG: hypothetical protein D6689_20260 [Deltaproteobacteria bacterium]|nr:MAG: hypothetical protein D6689_20260 [Deltaproteobacteria bacterium]